MRNSLKMITEAIVLMHTEAKVNLSLPFRFRSIAHNCNDFKLVVLFLLAV